MTELPKKVTRDEVMEYAIKRAKKKVLEWYGEDRGWIEALLPENISNGFEKYRIFVCPGSAPKGCIIADYSGSGTVKMTGVLNNHQSYTFKNVFSNGTLGDIESRLNDIRSKEFRKELSGN